MLGPVIALFFLLDASTGQLAGEPLIANARSILACEDQLTVLKAKAEEQTFPLEVVGMCIKVEDFH